MKKTTRSVIFLFSGIIIGAIISICAGGNALISILIAATMLAGALLMAIALQE